MLHSITRLARYNVLATNPHRPTDMIISIRQNHYRLETNIGIPRYVLMHRIMPHEESMLRNEWNRKEFLAVEHPGNYPLDADWDYCVGS